MSWRHIVYTDSVQSAAIILLTDFHVTNLSKISMNFNTFLSTATTDAIF